MRGRLVWSVTVAVFALTVLSAVLAGTVESSGFVSTVAAYHPEWKGSTTMGCLAGLILSLSVCWPAEVLPFLLGFVLSFCLPTRRLLHIGLLLVECCSLPLHVNRW